MGYFGLCMVGKEEFDRDLCMVCLFVVWFWLVVF